MSKGSGGGRKNDIFEGWCFMGGFPSRGSFDFSFIRGISIFDLHLRSVVMESAFTYFLITRVLFALLYDSHLVALLSWIIFPQSNLLWKCTWYFLKLSLSALIDAFPSEATSSFRHVFKWNETESQPMTCKFGFANVIVLYSKIFSNGFWEYFLH